MVSTLLSSVKLDLSVCWPLGWHNVSSMETRSVFIRSVLGFFLCFNIRIRSHQRGPSGGILLICETPKRTYILYDKHTARIKKMSPKWWVTNGWNTYFGWTKVLSSVCEMFLQVLWNDGVSERFQKCRHQPSVNMLRGSDPVWLIVPITVM